MLGHQWVSSELRYEELEKDLYRRPRPPVQIVVKKKYIMRVIVQKAMFGLLTRVDITEAVGSSHEGGRERTRKFPWFSLTASGVPRKFAKDNTYNDGANAEADK